MNLEKQKKLYRKKLRARHKERKKLIKSIKLAVKRRERRKPHMNLRSQLKEQLAPTFNRTAYMPESGDKKQVNNVFKQKKFMPSNWMPPTSMVDEAQNSGE